MKNGEHFSVSLNSANRKLLRVAQIYTKFKQFFIKINSITQIRENIATGERNKKGVDYN